MVIQGQRIVTRHVTDENQKYPVKYKGMSTCFHILARCLGGKYINFGVFWLYQDKAISDAFSVMLQMMLNIPLDDMMVHSLKYSRFHSILITSFEIELSQVDSNVLYDA